MELKPGPFPLRNRRSAWRFAHGDSNVPLPTWEAVLQHEYEAWTTARLVIDSSLVSASDAAELILGNWRSGTFGSNQRQKAANGGL